MNNLFSDFEKVSSKQWKLKIQADLKGVDYQTLITHTLENIDIKPFYHHDSFKAFEQLSPQKFHITQSLEIHDEKIANKIARNVLHKGARFFCFSFSAPFEIDILLSQLDNHQLLFKADMLDVDFLALLYKKTNGKAKIFVDPIGHFARTGNWYENQDKDFAKLKDLHRIFPADYQFLEIRSGVYKNAGASVVQELAYALAQAVEYAEYIHPGIWRQMMFSFATGSHFFFEIGKLKAFRKLHQLIENEYDINEKAVIYSEPTLRNKTLFDPYVNMLRTTMEMMSAILGGSDFVANMPFDKVYRKSNEFSERIARNQLIILQEESDFQSALHSTDGNYYVENISRQLAEKALDIFKQIEKSGGLLSQLYKGKVQQKIAETAQKEQMDFDEGKIVLVGTNKYINKDEKPENIEVYPFMKKRSEQTLIRPIVPKRLSEKLENERLTQLGIKL